MSVIDLTNHPGFKAAPPEPVDKKKGKKKPKGYRKDGRVKRTYTDGIKPDGKPNIKYFYGKTITEAEAARDAYIKKLESGLDVSKEELTVSDWLDSWAAAYKAHLGRKAKKSDQSHMSRVKQSIGSMKVTDVRNLHLQKIINNMSGMSTSSVRSVMQIMRHSFRKAVSNNIILRNPADDLTMPETTEGSHRALEPWEAVVVLEEYQHHRFGTLVKALMLTGMRPGEAAALIWAKVDMPNRQITIDDAVEMPVNQPIHRGKTKTEAGHRTLPMCNDLYVLLDATPIELRKGYVFLSAEGAQLSQSALDRGLQGYLHKMEQIINGGDPNDDVQKGRPRRKDLSKAKDVAQLELWKKKNEEVDEWERTRKKISFTLYDLRHTFCTALYDAGVDVKTAAYFMGHRDIETTLRIYTHLSEERSMRGAAAMVDFLNSWKPLLRSAEKQSDIKAIDAPSTSGTMDIQNVLFEE